jgi:hypothetical protein
MKIEPSLRLFLSFFLQNGTRINITTSACSDTAKATQSGTERVLSRRYLKKPTTFIPSVVLNLQFKVAEAALNLLVKFGILCR